MENEDRLKLYLVSQDEVDGWDTYDNFVCAVYNDFEASIMHPNENEDADWWLKEYNSGDWSAHKYVKVQFLGYADEKLEPYKILCKSYHAG